MLMSRLSVISVVFVVSLSRYQLAGTMIASLNLTLTSPTLEMDWM